ncbi:MAG: hypothetical protein V7767_15200 [Leeuwenhoekiella sp.]
MSKIVLNLEKIRMNTSYILICLVVVASICIPYLLFTMGGKRDVKNINTTIKNEISQNNLTISASEKWRNTYLGIDKMQRKALFLKISKIENTVQLLDLNEIRGFEIVEKRRELKIKDRKDMLLEQLDLKVNFLNSEIILLRFYDEIQDQYEDYELRRIDKWKAMLVDAAAKLPEKRVA